MKLSGHKKATITLLALPHARMGGPEMGDHIGSSALLLLCLTQATFNVLTDLVGELHVCFYSWQA